MAIQSPEQREVIDTMLERIDRDQDPAYAVLHADIGTGTDGAILDALAAEVGKALPAPAAVAAFEAGDALDEAILAGLVSPAG